jgi:hypothetical protein
VKCFDKHLGKKEKKRKRTQMHSPRRHHGHRSISSSPWSRPPAPGWNGGATKESLGRGGRVDTTRPGRSRQPATAAGLKRGGAGDTGHTGEGAQKDGGRR